MAMSFVIGFNTSRLWWSYPEEIGGTHKKSGKLAKRGEN